MKRPQSAAGWKTRCQCRPHVLRKNKTGGDDNESTVTYVCAVQQHWLPQTSRRSASWIQSVWGVGVRAACLVTCEPVCSHLRPPHNSYSGNNDGSEDVAVQESLAFIGTAHHTANTGAMLSTSAASTTLQCDSVHAAADLPEC